MLELFMAKKYIEELILGIIILLFVIVDYKIALGILIGFLFALINKKLLTYRINHLMESKKVSLLARFGGFISILLLSIPLLLSFLYPNILSWIGAFIGLLFDKLFLYLKTFIGVNHD